MIDTAHILALGLFVSLVIGTVAALWSTSWVRRGVALVAVCVTIAASMPGWRVTPDGILQDTFEYAHHPLVRKGWALWNGHTVIHGQGWQLYLVGLGHQWFGTWLVERALGLAWHCLFIVVVCTLLPLRLLLIVVPVLSCTPFGLWIQRHHMGSELLLAQALLVRALLDGRRVLAGWWLALANAGYMGSVALLAYPVIWLGRRAAWTYIVVGMLLLPLIATGLLDPLGYSVGHKPPSHFVRALQTFGSLWDAQYSVAIAWLWSYPGAQTLPPVLCVAIVLGLVYARDWRWTAALIAGALPSIVGRTNGAPSHRMMFMLLPLAVLAARCPPRITLALAIAVCGLLAWHDPAFWRPWKGAAIHAF